MSEFILDPYDEEERLDKAIEQLNRYAVIANREPDKIKTIDLRNTNIKLSTGLQHIQIAYTTHVGKQSLKSIECTAVALGVNRLICMPIIQDMANTNIYLMFNKNVNLQRRFLADSNNTLRFEFNEPYHTQYQRHHYIYTSTASQLGHICNEAKIDLNYMYIIAEMYGVMSLMEALVEIPSLTHYESFIEETKMFESQLDEYKDMLKIKYKLYTILNNQKLLSNIDEDVIKVLKQKGLIKVVE